jgi:hypothetical protein
LERREYRLKALAAAKATIGARASERFAQDQTEYEARLAVRAAKTDATGKKPRGKHPRHRLRGRCPRIR